MTGAAGVERMGFYLPMEATHSTLTALYELYPAVHPQEVFHLMWLLLALLQMLDFLTFTQVPCLASLHTGMISHLIKIE